MPAPTPTELTRLELFQRLWREPLSSVAADLGLSASGLAKLCDRTAIPYPTRGHWAKARAGRAGPTPDLPPAPEGASDQIRITPGHPTARRTPVRLSPEDRREQLMAVAARIRPKRVNKSAITAVAKTSKKPSTHKCTSHQRQYSTRA